MTDSTPIKLRIKLHFESIEEFIDGFAKYISAGGLFIPLAAEKQKPIGSLVRFQFLLKNGDTALLGEGVVKQLKTPPSPRVGMLVKFKKLSKSSQDVVKLAVEHKQRLNEATPMPESTQAIRGGFSRSAQGPTAVVKADPTLSLPQPPPPEATASLDFSSDILNHSLAADSLGDLETRASNEPGDVAKLTEVTRAQDDASLAPIATPTPAPAVDQDFFELAQSYAGSDSPDASPVQDPDELVDNPQGAAFDFDLDGLMPPELDRPSAPEVAPPELAKTEGGLSIMAYNSEANLDEESRGLAAFSLVEEDDDADIDAAFDDIFGGGGGGFDMFGGPSEPIVPEPAPQAPPPGPEPSAELESLLGSLEDDKDDNLTSLSLDLAPAPKREEPEDDESLEDLLALARQDIQSKKDEEDDPQANAKNVLEQLLGDDVELPSKDEGSFLNLPPPKLPTFDEDSEEEEVEEAPAAQEDAEAQPEEEEEDTKQKKSGLFSSLFRRRSDS